MSLPAVSCPSCNASMSLDVLLGHQGARDALLALATLHPGSRLQMTALRYVGLFAPKKQAMRFDRVADLLREVAELIAPCRVEWKGLSHPAPMEYWLDAMEDMLSRRAELDLPMDKHNYLRAAVAGNAAKAAGQAERSRDDQLAGRTPVGTPGPARPETAAKTLPPPPRFRPNADHFQSLRDAMNGVVPAAQSTEEPPNAR
jgi:hypothetical protein